MCSVTLPFRFLGSAGGTRPWISPITCRPRDRGAACARLIGGARSIAARLTCLSCGRRDSVPGLAPWVWAHAQLIGRSYSVSADYARTMALYRSLSRRAGHCRQDRCECSTWDEDCNHDCCLGHRTSVGMLMIYSGLLMRAEAQPLLTGSWRRSTRVLLRRSGRDD